jgi:hypothetical protein
LVGHQLKCLGKLHQLRYLGLRGTPVAELPSEIMEDLVHLQTLDVKGTELAIIPSTVTKLRKLIRLCLDSSTIMLFEVGKLTSLQELQMGYTSSWSDFATKLGKLTELRKLKVSFTEEDLQSLAEPVSCLQNLQDLHMDLEDVDDDVSKDIWDGWDSTLQQLHKLKITGCLDHLPAWVNHKCLPRLTHLRLMELINMRDARELDVLAKMPALCFLSIKIWTNDNAVEPDLCKWIVPGGGSFPNLRHAVLSGPIAN